jgi:hypothetical protein
MPSAGRPGEREFDIEMRKLVIEPPPMCPSFAFPEVPPPPEEEVNTLLPEIGVESIPRLSTARKAATRR